MMQRDGELVPVPESANFIMRFSDKVVAEYQVRLVVAPEIGYVRAGPEAVLTNAPLLVRMRQPSTNVVWCAIKAWDMLNDL